MPLQLLLIPLGGAAAELSDSLATPSGIAIVYERQAERRTSPARFLQDVDRELTRLFRAPRRNRGVRIVISPGRPPEEVAWRRNGKEIDLVLSDAFLEKIDDFEFRRELAGRLLLLRFDITDGTEKLPDWISAGLFDSLTVRLDTRGQVVRLNRNYPLLRSLLNAGTPPDFRQAMLADAGGFAGAPREAYAEICRFLLEMFAGISELKDNALADYAVERLRGRLREDEIFAATLERKLRQLYAGQAESTEALLVRIAGSSVFNGNFPRPARRLLAELPETLTAECEVPDRDGKPSGEFRRIRLPELPSLCRDEPVLGTAARLRLQENAAAFALRLPPDLQQDGRKLAGEIGLTGGKNVGEEKEKLQAIRDALERELRRRAEMEAFLEKAEEEHVSGLLLLHRRLGESLVNDDFLTQSGTAFLDEAERRYLD